MVFVPYLGIVCLAFILLLLAKYTLFPEVNRYQKDSFQIILEKAFPSSLHELPKFGVLRFIFGAVLVNRAFHQWFYIIPQDINDPTFLNTLIIITVLGVFIMIGFMTTLSLVAVVLMLFGEKALRSSTLGNDIGALLAILFVFCGSHHSLSVDRFLQNKWSKWFKFSGNKLFSYDLKLMPSQIARFKFVSVLSYWCLCLYSAFKHYDEPSWMSSDASFWLMTSSYLNEHFEIFRYLLTMPFFDHVLRYSMWLMFPWYMMFLPAFFIGGWVQKLNMFWWLCFLLLSTFVLQLGSMGYIELIYFAALLIVPLSRSRKQIEFFYDSKCNLCQRAVKIVRLFDITRRVRFVSAQSSKEYLEKNGIPLEDALYYLAGRYKDKFYKGYDLYIQVVSKLPLFWIFWPFLWLGKITKIGPAIYQKIADNRIKLFGVCELVPPKAPLYPEFKGNVFNKTFIKATFLTICSFALLFITFLPTGMAHESKFFEPFYKFYRAANILGISAINVFNKPDLQMSTHWRIMEYCQDANLKDCKLVPMTGEDGRRLHYHSSDSLYYGGSLRWRRKLINDGAVCDYGVDDVNKTGFLHQVAKLYLLENNIKEGYFKLTYHYLPLPKLPEENNAEYWEKDSFVCEKSFFMDDDTSRKK